MSKDKLTDDVGMDITLRVPRKQCEEMTPAEQDAETASLMAGVCLHMEPLGHVHIGAPLHGEEIVPVLRFEGDVTTRCEMNAGDAAALFIEIPQKQWDKHYHES